MKKVIEQFVVNALMGRTNELKINGFSINFFDGFNGFWIIKTDYDPEQTILGRYNTLDYMDAYKGLFLKQMVEDIYEDMIKLTGVNDDEINRLEKEIKELNGLKINIGEPKLKGM